MTINKAMVEYRLPNPTSQEDLEGKWGTVLTFGDKVLLAGYYYNGRNKPSYFGAVYERMTIDEDVLGIREVSEVKFEDDGHAIAWAIGRC